MFSKKLKVGFLFFILVGVVAFAFWENATRVDCLYKGEEIADEAAKSSIEHFLKIPEKKSIKYIKNESEEGSINYYYSVSEKIFKVNVIDENCVVEIELIS